MKQSEFIFKVQEQTDMHRRYSAQSENLFSLDL